MNTETESCARHDWRPDSDQFTSWRDCTVCGKREWFMEADLS